MMARLHSDKLTQIAADWTHEGCGSTSELTGRDEEKRPTACFKNQPCNKGTALAGPKNAGKYWALAPERRQPDST